MVWFQPAVYIKRMYEKRNTKTSSREFQERPQCGSNLSTLRLWVRKERMERTQNTFQLQMCCTMEGRRKGKGQEGEDLSWEK